MSCPPICPGIAANDVSPFTAGALASADEGEPISFETTGNPADASPHFTKALRLIFPMEAIGISFLYGQSERILSTTIRHRRTCVKPAHTASTGLLQLPLSFHWCDKSIDAAPHRGCRASRMQSPN